MRLRGQLRNCQVFGFSGEYVHANGRGDDVRRKAWFSFWSGPAGRYDHCACKRAQCNTLSLSPQSLAHCYFKSFARQAYIYCRCNRRARIAQCRKPQQFYQQASNAPQLQCEHCCNCRRRCLWPPLAPLQWKQRYRHYLCACVATATAATGAPTHGACVCLPMR